MAVPSAPVLLPFTAGTPSVTNVGNGSIRLSPKIADGLQGQGVTSYKINRSTTSGTEVQVAAGVSLPYFDNGLVDKQIYFYTVIATNGSGDSAASNEVSAICSSEPGVAGKPSDKVYTIQGPTPGTSGTAVPLAVASVQPAGDVEVVAVNQNAAASMTVNLGATAGKTTYLCGFWVDGLGATAASVIEVTTTGVLGGTMRRELSVPAGATLAIAAPIYMEFNRPIPASGVNVAITVVVPSFGAGNTNAVVGAHGFRR